MTLYDIENAVRKILAINPGCTEEKLTFLLSSAGWDAADITDAGLLWQKGTFKDMISNVVLPSETVSSLEMYKSHMPTEEVTHFDVATTEKPAVSENIHYELPHNLPIHPLDQEHHEAPLAKEENSHHVVSTKNTNQGDTQEKHLLQLIIILFLVFVVLLGYTYSSGR